MVSKFWSRSVTQPFQVLWAAGVHDFGVRHAGALASVRRIAALAVHGLPQVPAQPGAGVIGRVDIDVLVERHDGDVDVVGGNRRALQLGEQIVRGGLQRGHLSALRHRPGVIEHQRYPQSGIAPGGGRRRGDIDRVNAQHAEKIRVDDGAAIERQCRSADRRIIHADGDVLSVWPHKQGIEVGGRGGLQLLGCLQRRGLRQHQRGRIERGLEGRAGGVGARVVDRSTYGAQQRDDGEADHGGDAPMPVLPETGQQHRSTPFLRPRSDRRKRGMTMPDGP